MKKLLAVIFSVLVSTSLFGQDHLLITEFVVTPTGGEFVEIYNPTADFIDLTNYYLTDATYSGGGVYYYKIVEGNGGGGGFGDFNAKFPDGAKIGPGEYQTVSLAGSDKFTGEFGVDPTYELFEDGANPDSIPDMVEATPGSINGQGGFSNSGEVLVLYYWDGASDLVQDVDYVVWGDKKEAIDKTGVSIDGPDAGTDSSTYLNDIAIADQFVVNADNDDDDDPHDFGMSAQRKLDVEDVENWLDGNGITGHNEMSEDISWKGGIWSINAPATPNARALGDSLNIADLQFVRADSIGVNANDNSPMLGDTVTVTGIVMQGIRDIYLGARWGGFVQDERGGPWSGFFVIQHDTSVTGTDITVAQTGDKIKMTGVVAEYPTGPNTPSITQFALLTDPAVPIEFLEFDVPLPDPVLITPGDLGANGTTADPMLSERWEGVLARFEGLTVTGNGLPGNTMNAGDETGTIVLDDYFNAINAPVTNNGGVWPGFPVGTKINVTGFIRGGSSQGLITINPRSLADIEVASAPPEIRDISRNPVVPTSSEGVEISATIVDAQTTVAKAELYYSVDGGAFQKIDMATADSVYKATIPAQANNAMVEFFLAAEDDEGDASSVPGDTSASKLFYFVRDDGLKIFDVQFSPYQTDASSFSGLEVTVSGIVTTDTTDFSFYWIQDGTDPWNGVWVNDNVNNAKMGDMVTVTGTVEERFGVTRINNISAFTVESSGNAVPGPVVVKTGDIMTGGSMAENYEGMLIRVENVKVTVPFSDGGSNFGEFTIDDGSGGIRVDDLSPLFRGNLDSAFVQDDSLVSVTGILHYSFSNHKIEPRNANDVVRYITDVDDNLQIPLTFDLEQNYPNPFNPETTIEFQLAKKGMVSIAIYNMLGQKIKTLVDAVRPAGSYKLIWNGTDNSGIKVSSGIYFYKMKSADFIKTQKMLLMK